RRRRRRRRSSTSIPTALSRRLGQAVSILAATRGFVILALDRSLRMLLNDVGRLLLVRVDITALGEVLVTLLIDLDRLVLVCVNITLLCGVAVVLLGADGRGVLGADVGRLLALGGVLPRVQAARGRVVLAARGRLSQLAVLPDDRLALPRALVYVPGDVVRVLRGVRPVGVGLDVELAPHAGRPVVEGPEFCIPGAL
ncbi:unnamed protein product, partial [Prorocentrum cordatum]